MSIVVVYWYATEVWTTRKEGGRNWLFMNRRFRRNRITNEVIKIRSY